LFDVIFGHFSCPFPSTVSAPSKLSIG
jgi:hypothetical protein